MQSLVAPVEPSFLSSWGEFHHGYSTPPKTICLLSFSDGYDPDRHLTLEPDSVDAFERGYFVVETEDLDALETCRPFWERRLMVVLSHNLRLPPRGAAKVWFVPAGP